MTYDWDAMGKAVIEARADATVAAIVGTSPSASPVRVAAGDPKPDWALGPGEYMAFVVLVSEGVERWKRVPVQRPRIIARCYGRSYAEAGELAAAVSNAFHDRGTRTHANGLGIWKSFHDAGGEQDKDPDTDQPFVPIILDLIATTQAVA